MPSGKANTALMQQRMQQDLKGAFGYDVRVEDRMMPCWKLTVTPDAKARLMTKTPGDNYRFFRDENGRVSFRNGSVKDIIAQLEILYGVTHIGQLTALPGREPSFIDATGIAGDVDYAWDEVLREKIYGIGTKENTLENFSLMLEKIGIKLVKSTQKMKVVVIRDSK
jgi:hypothetical protein